MNQVSSIVISRKDFKTDEELYLKVAQQIRLLLEADYLIVAEDVEQRGGTIVIQYSPNVTDGSVPRPFWLLPNEMTAAANVHIDNEVKKAKEVIQAADAADKFSDIFGDLVKKDGNKGGYDA